MNERDSEWMPDVLVVAALRQETTALRSRLRHKQRRRWHGLRMVSGHMGECDRVIAVAHCGIGRVAAHRFARSMQAIPEPQLTAVDLVIIGLAGALDPKLELGSVHEVLRVGAVPGKPEWPDEAAARQLREQDWIELDCSASSGAALLTVPELLLEPAEKRSAQLLVQQSLGEQQAVGAMVDMETAHLLRSLSGRMKTVRCARAISDTADARLPVALAGSAGPRWHRLALDLVLRPALAAELLRLGRTTRRCGRGLADWLEQTLA